MKRANPLTVAIGVYVVWIALTVGIPVVTSAGQTDLTSLVTRGIATGIAAAAIFLAGAVAIFGWRRPVGLVAVHAPRSLWVLMPPAIVCCLMLAGAAAIGFPPATIVLFVLLNTALVGWSEELMFRGFALFGLLSRFSIWTAIVISCAMFGAVHFLNGFMTGDFLSSTVQTFVAGISGIWLMAVRLRTRSIFPAMVIHALWDFSTFMFSSAAARGSDTVSSSDPNLVQQIILPFAPALPLFLYGIWLLRHVGREEKETFAPAP